MKEWTMEFVAAVFSSSGGFEAIAQRHNRELAELRRENDELFKIKQRTVVANRELIAKLATLELGRP
jgi:hypothetical protein